VLCALAMDAASVALASAMRVGQSLIARAVPTQRRVSLQME